MRLGASPRLVVALGAVHLGAVPCSFANNLPLAAQCLLVACVLLGAARYIALHGTRRARRSVVRLVWDGHGRWRLLQRDGALLDVGLEHGAYVHPKLLILPFRTRSGERWSVLVVPDMVDADTLRRLRIRLRCELGQDP
jgi:toxin CptA